MRSAHSLWKWKRRRRHRCSDKLEDKMVPTSPNYAVCGRKPGPHRYEEYGRCSTKAQAIAQRKRRESRRPDLQWAVFSVNAGDFDIADHESRD